MSIIRWMEKKAEHWRIDVFELWCWESPWTARRSNQSILKEISHLIFIGRTDVEAETPILWPPDAKSWLIWKDPDVGKDWGHEEKGMTEDEMVGWHHQLNGHGFGWTPGVGDGQGALACYGSCSRKESDTTERLNWTELMSTIFVVMLKRPAKYNECQWNHHFCCEIHNNYSSAWRLKRKNCDASHMNGIMEAWHLYGFNNLEKPSDPYGPVSQSWHHWLGTNEVIFSGQDRGVPEYCRIFGRISRFFQVNVTKPHTHFWQPQIPTDSVRCLLEAAKLFLSRN